MTSTVNTLTSKAQFLADFKKQSGLFWVVFKKKYISSVISYPEFPFFLKCAAGQCRPIQSRLFHLSSPWLSTLRVRHPAPCHQTFEVSGHTHLDRLQTEGLGCGLTPLLRKLTQGKPACAPAEMYATPQRVFSVVETRNLF